MQFYELDRKSLINTTESRKNVFSPSKVDFLPDINNLGKTALIRRGKPYDQNL